MYSDMSIVIQTFHIHTTNPCPIIIIYIKVMETCTNGPKELNRYKKLRVFNSTRWANRAVLGEDYRWASRPTSSLLSLATGDLIQSEKHCVVLQPRVTGTHALCNLNGTPRLYYRPQFSLFAFTHIGWNGTKNQSCYRTCQRNIHTRIRQILRCLLIFLPCLYHEHKSSCRSETKMQQTPFNRGKQRRKKLGDYSQCSIPDLPTSSLQSCARLHTSGRESARNRLGSYVLISGSLYLFLSKQLSQTIAVSFTAWQSLVSFGFYTNLTSDQIARIT